MMLLDEQIANRTRVARQKSRRLQRRGWIADMIGQAKQYAESMRECSDSDLQTHTEKLRHYAQDEPIDSDRMLVLAASAVVESIRRVLNLELFDVQLHAGMIASQGAIAEMQTGEGKTLAVAFPAYLWSLAGRGVHVATPNGYLAERDWAKLTPVFHRLGVTTGLLRQDANRAQTGAAYRADITYGPGYAFGFDYLRDQLALERIDSASLGAAVLRRFEGLDDRAELLQRGLHAAIIDEADHVLVDDAVSPLILTFGSEHESPDAEIHRRAKGVAEALRAERDFRIAGRTVELTDRGFDQVYELAEWAIHPQLVRPWHEYVVLALRARAVFRRDTDYVIRGGKIQIVDPSTGRIFEDRTWSEGLHQAIEAYESLPIHCERVAEARVTRQRFYRSYERLAGMTGTALGCERELASVYGLPVSSVPLRKPSRRRIMPNHYSVTKAEKRVAIADECEAMVARGRSVLVGTLHITDSLAVAGELQSRGLTLQLLNGVQDADEALVVLEAGQPGAITVATNLAGRGTDIPLHPEVANKGGLHVIVSQPHALARVDRQLMGRCARCGDPGSARLFLCAEDPPAVDEAPWIGRAIRRWAARGRSSSLRLSDRLEQVQKRNQRQAASQRWELLESDRDDDRWIRRNRSPDHCYQLS
jgi:preprotein translocase subunit SecA